MNEKKLIQQRQQQLAKVYDPQEQFIQQQMKALPGQFAGQKSSLEQAKVNAFRDITNTAQSRGMFFSGFQPAEQARYLGEKFLPGMQDIAARQEQGRLGLLEQLIGLRGQRTQGMTDFQERLRQEAMERQQKLEDRRFQATQAEKDRRFTASQNAASRASSAKPVDPFGGYGIERKESGAGFSFKGPGGRPISMAQYAQSTGTGIAELLRQSESDYDKKALSDMQKWAGQGWSEKNIVSALRARYPALF
jgi:hypothetical protein